MSEVSVISSGDLFVGAVTLLLAIATFSLVWVEYNSNKKERQRLRLKEQLEGLYSPVIGLGTPFEDPVLHSKEGNPVRATMEHLRNVYSYLATGDLKKMLKNYYDSYYNPNLMPNTDNLRNLRKLFTDEYEEFSKKYRELTS